MRASRKAVCCLAKYSATSGLGGEVCNDRNNYNEIETVIWIRQRFLLRLEIYLPNLFVDFQQLLTVPRSHTWHLPLSANTETSGKL